MALAVDYMGAGMPQEQAVRAGYSELTSLAGVGTTQAGGKAIPNFTNNVATVTAGGQTAFVLPSAAELNMPYLVSNSNATTALIFPHSGGKINAAATDASVTIAVDLARIFIRITATRWISFHTT